MSTIDPRERYIYDSAKKAGEEYERRKREWEQSQRRAKENATQKTAPNQQANTSSNTTYKLTSKGKTYTLNQDQVDWIRSAHKNSWNDAYAFDDEDQRRKAAGLVPLAYAQHYNDNELDNWLLENDLPSAKYLESYLEEYDKYDTARSAAEKEYNRIGEFYSTVAGKWWDLEFNGIENIAKEYSREDGTPYSGTEAYENAFFDVLASDEWADVRKYFTGAPAAKSEQDFDTNRAYREYEIDQMKKAASEQEKDEKAQEEKYDFSSSLEFTYDDFFNEYGKYKDGMGSQMYDDEHTWAEAMDVRKKQFFNDEIRSEVTNRESARQWVDDNVSEYSDPSQMLVDLSGSGIAFRHVRQAYNRLKHVDGLTDEQLAKIEDTFDSLKKDKQGHLEQTVDPKAYTFVYDAANAVAPELTTADSGRLIIQDAKAAGYSDDDILAAVSAASGLYPNLFPAGLVDELKSQTEPNANKDRVDAAFDFVSAKYDELIPAITEGIDSEREPESFFAQDNILGNVAKVVDAVMGMSEMGRALRGTAKAYNTLLTAAGVDTPSAPLTNSEKRRAEIDAAFVADVSKQLADEGYTDFEIAQALSRKGLQDYIDKDAWAKSYYNEVIAPRNAESIGNNFTERTLTWEELSDAQRADIRDSVENWQFNPDINKTWMQQLEMQYEGNILARTASNLFSGAVNLADLITSGGRESEWAFTEAVNEFNTMVNSYGKAVNQDAASDWISRGSDAATELVRMYMLGQLGGAFTSGLGKAAPALARASSTASKGMKALIGGINYVVSSTPFVASAIGSYYSEALSDPNVNVKDAVNYALLCGVAEGAIEAFNVDKIWGKTLGSTRYVKALANGTSVFSKADITGRLRIISLVAGFLGEFAEESASYAFSTWNQNRLLHQNSEFDINEMIEQGFMGGLIGLAGASSSMPSVTADGALAEYIIKNEAYSPTNLDLLDAISRAGHMSTEKYAELAKGGKILTKQEFQTVSREIARAAKTIQTAEVNRDKTLKEAKAKREALRNNRNGKKRKLDAVSSKTNMDAYNKALEELNVAQRTYDEFNEGYENIKQKARDTYESILQEQNSAMEKANLVRDSHYVALAEVFKGDLQSIMVKVLADGRAAIENRNYTEAVAEIDEIVAADDLDTEAYDEAVIGLGEAAAMEDKATSEVVDQAAMDEKMLDAKAGTLQEGTRPAEATTDAAAKSKAVEIPVKVDGNKKLIAVPNKDKAAIISLGKQLGSTVEFRDDLPSYVSGKYENGKLILNGKQLAASSSDLFGSMAYRVLVHEFTHSLEGSREYQAFADFVIAEEVRKANEELADSGVTVSALDLYHTKQAEYADASDGNINLSLSQARKEIVSRYAQNYLLTDEAAINRMVREKAGLAGRVLNWIHYTIAKTGARNKKDSASLALINAERLYAKAFAANSVKPSEAMKNDSSAEYSVESVEAQNENPATAVYDIESGMSWAQLGEKYGTIDKGQNPRVRDAKVPQKTADDNRVSKLNRSIMESKRLASKEIVEEARDMIMNGGLGVYNPTTNSDNKKKANEWILNNGGANFEQVKNTFVNHVDAGVKVKDGAKMVAVGEQLLAEAAKIGDADSLFDVWSSLAMLATQSGQTTQAFSMLKAMKGHGAAYYMEKIVKGLNNRYADQIAAGKMERLEIDPALLEDLVNAKTFDEISLATDAISRDIGQKLPLTGAEALANWRYFSMLANPVTHFRNLTGNTAMAGMRRAKNVVAAGISAGLEKTGLISAEDRVHAVYSRTEQASRIEKASNMFEKYRDEITGGGKYGFEDMMREYKRKSPIKAVDSIMKFNEELLNNKEDVNLFMKPAFVDSFVQYMVAQNIDPNNMTDAQERAAAKWAVAEAQRATFRDASALAATLQRVSQSGWLGTLAIEGAMPFKKTPINVLKRGVEYSPIGVVQGVSQLYKAIHNPNSGVTAAAAIDRLSAGITGSALYVLGVFLAKYGLLRGLGEDENYEGFLGELGEQTYALDVFGVSVKLNNITPAAIPLFMGAALYEYVLAGDEPVSVDDVANVVASVANPIMEMSFMSSLNEALKSYSSSDSLFGNIGQVLLTGARSYASQYIPTIGGKINSVIDPYERTVKSDKTSPFGGQTDSWLRSQAKKIIGASFLLEPDVNVKGKTTTHGIRRDGFGAWALDFANSFILPTNITVKEREKADNEIIRLYEVTGNVDILPTSPSKYFTVDKKRIDLNAKQYTEYSKQCGETVYAAIKQLLASSKYIGATDEKRADMLSDTIRRAENTVRDVWKEKLG